MDLELIILELLGPNANIVLVEYWTEKACNSIIKYLNKDYTIDECKEKFKDAIIQLVISYNQEKQLGNVKSMSQGQRSVTYADESEAFEKVKKLLPKPFVRLF